MQLSSKIHPSTKSDNREEIQDRNNLNSVDKELKKKKKDKVQKKKKNERRKGARRKIATERSLPDPGPGPPCPKSRPMGKSHPSSQESSVQSIRDINLEKGSFYSRSDRSYSASMLEVGHLDSNPMGMGRMNVSAGGNSGHFSRAASERFDRQALTGLRQTAPKQGRSTPSRADQETYWRGDQRGDPYEDFPLRPQLAVALEPRILEGQDGELQSTSMMTPVEGCAQLPLAGLSDSLEVHASRTRQGGLGMDEFNDAALGDDGFAEDNDAPDQMPALARTRISTDGPGEAEFNRNTSSFGNTFNQEISSKRNAGGLSASSSELPTTSEENFPVQVGPHQKSLRPSSSFGEAELKAVSKIKRKAKTKLKEKSSTMIKNQGDENADIATDHPQPEESHVPLGHSRTASSQSFFDTPDTGQSNGYLKRSPSVQNRDVAAIQNRLDWKDGQSIKDGDFVEIRNDNPTSDKAAVNSSKEPEVFKIGQRGLDKSFKPPLYSNRSQSSSEKDFNAPYVEQLVPFAYTLFYREEQQRMSKDNLSKDVAQMIGQKWSLLSEKQKKPWYDQASQIMATLPLPKKESVSDENSRYSFATQYQRCYTEGDNPSFSRLESLRRSVQQEGLTWRENKLGTTASPAGSMTKTEVQDSGPSSTEVSDITMNGQPVVPSPQKWERKGEVPVSPLKEVPECDSKLTWPEPYDQEVSFRLEERIGESDRFDVRRELLHTKQLLVLSLTWNQQAKQGPLAEELQNKLLPMNRYHLISVGTQECENGFAKSLVVTSKKNWETVLQEALGNNYFKVCAHTLQASHLIVFAHKALRQWISAVSSAAVATGVGNRLGNKGGIGIRMCLGSTQLLVVNSHLAAHQGKTNERNSQYNRIAHDLHRTFTGRPVSENQNPLIDEYDLVIWGGDLNYRIDSTREVVDACLEKNMHEVLLEYDELRQCMDRKSCFQGYAEGPLNFRPTYKFDKDADVYDTSPKMRIPSWTDRILYKKNSGMKLMCYKSVPDLRISDHRPVCASFSCPLQGLSDANYPAVYQASHSQIRRQSLQPKNKSEVCSIQ